MKILKFWPLPILVLVIYGLWFSWRHNSDLKKIVNIMLPPKIQMTIAKETPVMQESKVKAKESLASNNNNNNKKHSKKKNTKALALNKSPEKKKNSHTKSRGIASVPSQNRSSENKMYINSKKRVVIE